MTTITVSTETKEQLRMRGKKGETFDQIILKILNNIECSPSLEHGRKL